MLHELTNRLCEMRSRILSHVFIFNEPEQGIEIEFVFGGECTVEEFETTLSYLSRRPNLYAPLKRIIDEANGRTIEERARFVDSLTSPKRGILITEGAREERERELRFRQFIIDINSMSPSNLINMQRAIENLSEGIDTT